MARDSKIGDQEVTVEHRFREDAEGFWIDVSVNGMPYSELGPFDTAGERDLANADLINMMQAGGQQNPARVQ